MREQASGRYQPFGARPYFGRMDQERLVILWRGLNSHLLAASARLCQAFALPANNNTALSPNIAAKTSASRTSAGLVNEPGAFRANTRAMPKQRPAKSVLMIPCCAESRLREVDIAQQVDGKLPQMRGPANYAFVVNAFEIDLT